MDNDPSQWHDLGSKPVQLHLFALDQCLEAMLYFEIQLQQLRVLEQQRLLNL
jgi:hypothetical protein